jgi:hypothetical protein
MEEGITRLKDLLQWSNRLGRDEVDEIKEIIKILEDV